nr:hypothetical protein [Tanacetum cinerariifolium]
FHIDSELGTVEVEVENSWCLTVVVDGGSWWRYWSVNGDRVLEDDKD